MYLERTLFTIRVATVGYGAMDHLSGISVRKTLATSENQN